jgi:mxaJ protein
MTLSSPVRALAVLLALVVAGAGAPGEVRAGSWELRVCADPDNLPFSNRAGEGFDNKIVAILAEALDADITYVWLPDRNGRTRQRFVQGGKCDLVAGVLEGQPGFLTSYPYYRTGYVFVQRADAPFAVSSLDDPVLKTLRIGVPGGLAKLVPPGVALANRGIVANQVHFIDRKDPATGRPLVLQALVDGTIDVAIAWGPVAGEVAREIEGLRATPVNPEIDVPFIPMVASLAIGFRPGDEALRDEADVALARTWEATRAALEAAAVPLVDLPKPTPTVAGGG